MPFTVRLLRNDIPNVAKAVSNNSGDAVRDSAGYIREYARSIAPVRTGAFRQSLYVSGPGNGESDYTESAGMALSHNSAARIVPEIKPSTRFVDGVLRNTMGQYAYLWEAIIASAVEYSLYLEEGTVHMAPQPTLRPAALHGEQTFLNSMKHVADGF